MEYTPLDKTCYSCCSRNFANEITYDQIMEYNHVESKLRCPKCQHEVDVSQYIITTDVYIGADHKMIIMDSNDTILDDTVSELYDAVHYSEEFADQIQSCDPGKYLLHIYYTKYDDDSKSIVEIIYKELVESYKTSCVHCGDEYIRRNMANGIIFGYSNKIKFDGKFLLCKKCFNELKTYSG